MEATMTGENKSKVDSYIPNAAQENGYLNNPNVDREIRRPEDDLGMGLDYTVNDEEAAGVNGEPQYADWGANPYRMDPYGMGMMGISQEDRLFFDLACMFIEQCLGEVAQKMNEELAQLPPEERAKAMEALMNNEDYQLFASLLGEYGLTMNDEQLRQSVGMSLETISADEDLFALLNSSEGERRAALQGLVNEGLIDQKEFQALEGFLRQNAGAKSLEELRGIDELSAAFGDMSANPDRQTVTIDASVYNQQAQGVPVSPNTSMGDLSSTSKDIQFSQEEIAHMAAGLQQQRD